jgi:hypothetical protein
VMEVVMDMTLEGAGTRRVGWRMSCIRG